MGIRRVGGLESADLFDEADQLSFHRAGGLATKHPCLLDSWVIAAEWADELNPDIAFRFWTRS